MIQDIQGSFKGLKEIASAFKASDFKRANALANDPGFKSRLEDDFLRLMEVDATAKRAVEDALGGDVEHFLGGVSEVTKDRIG